MSDPTLVDLMSDFFCSMYQHSSLFIYLFIVGGALHEYSCGKGLIYIYPANSFSNFMQLTFRD